MDEKKFWETRRKICNDYYRCSDGCPLYSRDSNSSCRDIEKGAPIVEQWLADHGEPVEKPKLDSKALAEVFEELGGMLSAICDEQSPESCDGCPLKVETYACLFVSNAPAEQWEKVIRAVETWRNRDRSKRIRPTECVRVYTFELTDIRKSRENVICTELSQERLKKVGSEIAKEIRMLWRVDDVKCVKAQQFVTKWREDVYEE